MSVLSGKKRSTQEVRDFLPDYQTEEVITVIGGQPRSVKKYLPVRISTAYLDDPLSSKKSNSARKTMGLSTIQPIRNLHKLLESPKGNARKRLDNLFETKPKEKVISSRVTSHVLSAKKVGPSMPVVAANINKKTETKTPVSKLNQTKSRRSKILPPGTITGSYVNNRSSLAPRTIIYKPSNRLTLAHINLPTKRPSDVAEESPQPLESSYGSSDNVENVALDDNIENKSTKTEKIEVSKEMTLPNDSLDHKTKSPHHCKCSENKNDSRSAENACNCGMKVLSNSEAIVQRPTVIVTQESVATRILTGDNNTMQRIYVQEGSYSETLGLQPPANNPEIDESLLFKHTENVCARYENKDELNCGNKMAGIVHKIISTNKERLKVRCMQLIKLISQQEESLTCMKLMLEDINVHLEEHEKIESKINSTEFSNLNEEELSLIFAVNFNMNDCRTSFQGDLGSSRGRGRPKGGKTRKSKNYTKPQGAVEEKNDKASSVLGELNQTENKVENRENEPPQRRRSARLANKNADHLLSPMNTSTPATSKQTLEAKSKPCTPRSTTPARNTRWARRSERPLREYMVLKSAMKFLKTPDSKRYQIGSDEKVKIPESVDKNDDAILTDRLMKEFHELYSTP